MFDESRPTQQGSQRVIVKLKTTRFKNKWRDAYCKYKANTGSYAEKNVMQLIRTN